MAKKSFLNYGTQKGLATTIDWGGIINQRQQNEQLTDQAKDAQYRRNLEFVEGMDPYVSEVPWVTEKLNGFYDEQRKKVHGFIKENPGFQYDLKKMMEFNQLKNTFANNDIVQLAETSKRNYDQLLNGKGNMSPLHLKRESEKWANYINNTDGSDSPYIFDVNKPYNINELITEGAEILNTQVSSENYETEEYIDSEESFNAAAIQYSMYKDEYDDFWTGFQNKDKYKGNIITWVQKSIEATFKRGIETDFASKTRLAAANASAKAKEGHDWYEQEVLSLNQKGLNGNTHLGNDYLAFTKGDGDINGATLSNPDEVYTIVKGPDGTTSFKPVNGNFNGVKAMKVLEGYVDEQGDEYVKVQGLVDLNDATSSTYDPSNPNDPNKAIFESMNLRDITTRAESINMTLLAGLNLPGAEKGNIPKSKYFTGTFYIPINRFHPTARNKFNTNRNYTNSQKIAEQQGYRVPTYQETDDDGWGF